MPSDGVRAPGGVGRGPRGGPRRRRPERTSPWASQGARSSPRRRAQHAGRRVLHRRRWRTRWRARSPSICRRWSAAARSRACTRFEAGKVVDASAERGEEYLISLLDTDEGARRLGELGIGTNYGIDRGTRDVLLDEKIGGTVHMAVGASYPECGGTQRERRPHRPRLRPAGAGGSRSTARRSRRTVASLV